MRGGKAFFVTYILFYILSWVKFSWVYHWLGHQNLGFVNLGLLILFFVAIYKTIRFGKPAADMASDMKTNRPFSPQIDQEIKTQGKELGLEKAGERITRTEFNTVDEIAEALAEIQRAVENYHNSLPQEERKKIAHILQVISRKEDIFKEGIKSLQKIFERIGAIDRKHLHDLKNRMDRVPSKERPVLKAEIEREEEKLKIEKALLDFQTRQDQYLDAFNKWLRLAVEHISHSPYPYDARSYLSHARVVLKDISVLLKEIKALEGKLMRHTKAEQSLLKKERQAA
jgi:hypothetical protein